MNKTLAKQCELFIQNRDAIKPIARFDFPEMLLVGSSIYTFKNREVDAEKLKECNKILKQNTHIFSEFRDFVRVLICCNMALSQNPEQYLNDIRGIYENFQKSKLFGSNFRLLAATILYEHLASTSKNIVNDSQKYVDQTFTIFQQIQDAHPWLTSNFNLPFAAMLAISSQNINQKIKELEECFNKSSQVFSSASARQILSQALVLGNGTINEKCQKAASLWQNLKASGFKLGKSYPIAILGAAACIDYDEKELIQDILDADHFLKHQKGFGIFGVDASSRHIFSVLLAMNHHCAKNTTAQQIATNSALALAIELELIILMVIMMNNIAMSTISASSH